MPMPTGSGLSVSVKLRFEERLIVSLSVAELFAAFESLTKAGGVTDAVFTAFCAFEGSPASSAIARARLRCANPIFLRISVHRAV